jgi:hypothetical protein
MVGGCKPEREQGEKGNREREEKGKEDEKVQRSRRQSARKMCVAGKVSRGKEKQAFGFPEIPRLALIFYGTPWYEDGSNTVYNTPRPSDRQRYSRRQTMNNRLDRE